ncbi:MAG: glycine cleavage system protein GcvH [Candidatus Omnitrophica bacterium]|nr:glycine cleavage system protein GcvH [Candidatus Omnitrophota bacterium]
MNIEKRLFYTKEHEWVRIEGKEATIGISDYAQASLGDVTFVELPEIGAEVEQFKPIAAIESVKTASEIYAPLSGKVIKVNEEIVHAPELINQAPYTEGWFAVIELKDEAEKANLMDDAVYEEYLIEIGD